MLNPKLYVVLMASVLVMASCASQQGAGTGRRSLPADAVPVGVSSNGSHVSLDVGQILYVELPENSIAWTDLAVVLAYGPDGNDARRSAIHRVDEAEVRRFIGGHTATSICRDGCWRDCD